MAPNASDVVTLFLLLLERIRVVHTEAVLHPTGEAP